MTPMQREFCRHYAENPDAQAAALAAGYSKQYSKSKSAKLLDNPDIVHEIQRLRSRINERAEKSATDVVNEYATIAFTDRTGFLKEDPLRPGEFIYKAPHELSDEQRALVEKVNTTRRQIETEEGKVWRQEYNYVLLDKANALQQMGRHFGIFDDKLRLESNSKNPFANATPEQLAQLKESVIGIMTTGGTVVDGEYTEQKPGLLRNGKRRTGPGG